jgi:hypothetical protein
MRALSFGRIVVMRLNDGCIKELTGKKNITVRVVIVIVKEGVLNNRATDSQLLKHPSAASIRHKHQHQLMDE